MNGGEDFENAYQKGQNQEWPDEVTEAIRQRLLESLAEKQKIDKRFDGPGGENSLLDSE